MRRVPFVHGSLLALALTAAAGPGAADGWKTTCTAERRCTALLVVADTATKRILASIGLQVGAGGSDPVMIAFLPLGIALTPGFRAVIGDKAFDAAYEVCYPDGCRATAPVAAGDLNLWLDGETVSLRFFPYGAEKPVAADTPLAGLRESLGDILNPPN